MKLRATLEKCKFAPLTSEICLFVMDEYWNELYYVFVYVDDIIISSKALEECENIEKMLADTFVLSAMHNSHSFWYKG